MKLYAYTANSDGIEDGVFGGFGVSDQKGILTNNIAGGALTFQGGQGKGSGAGGSIVFQTANAAGSGSSLNSIATA